MDKKLSRLKRALDSTYFKNSSFKESQKYSILNNIKNNELDKKPSFIIKKALSLGVISALTIGIGLFTFDKMNTQDAKEPNMINSEISTNANAPVVKKQNKDLSKEEVNYLLLNSMDYFDTAKGNLDFKSKNQTETNIEYQVDMNKTNPIGYEKNGDIIKIAKNGEYKTINAKTENVIRNAGYEKYVEATDEEKKVENRYSKGNDGKEIYNIRTDHPIVGIAKGSLFPQEITTNLLQDYNNWTIEDQNTDYLGRDSIIISGSLEEDNAIKFSSKTFKFWVDKKTGILLTYEIYDAQGNTVEFLKTKDIMINEKLDDSILKLN
ncbi:hypothetical protein ABE65_011470 [Fictibacillus phosphorivorans]|uniref:MucB/RseB N-terminal domain-containing protein n=1 Tax=Fictibacillus phosphorivorans TaxID=1221500 RepID=A0A160IMY5_9BACL|nr:hypothetical protein [Fictibacillus phosphorivorans]ANC77387.1 hypothetical protein ABE65_011470 [Fictibacillus phosphorivorans]